MSRVVTSLIVAVALLGVALAGPCLACSLATQPQPAQGNCCHHGGCEKPTKAPAPASCATPDPSLAMIERVWTQVAHAGAVVLTPVTVGHTAPLMTAEAERLPLVDEYSPPDLYLRNSVLNI